MSRASLLAIALTGALFSASCGGQPEPPKAPAAPVDSATGATPAPAGPSSAASATAPAPAPASGDAPPKPWKELTVGEKKTHMKTVVFPKMQASFQEFDKADFKDFNCGTCHGPRARSGDFRMPNPDLPKVSKKLMDAHPEAAKFMMNKVVPQMASMLGMQPYDPSTHQGFGCAGCHTME